MRRLSQILLIVLRALIGFEVVLGIAFWTGHWYSLVSVHRTGGMLFVLTLWTIAALALAQRRNAGLAAFAIVWGLAIAGLGFSQQRILPGDLHWIVRVTHLVLAMAAMPIAERLARKPSLSAAAPQVASN